MIKVMYYIGTCDKDTCKKELLDRDFYKVFNELFINYTLQKAQGVYTMQDAGTVVKEDTFIITTFIETRQLDDVKECCEVVFDNVQVLKNKLNQELILVEVTKPEIMFL